MHVACPTPHVVEQEAGSPVNLASQSNDAEEVKLLLAHPDIQVNLKNRRGQTPLHLASQINLKLLLAHPDIQVNAQTRPMVALCFTWLPRAMILPVPNYSWPILTSRPMPKPGTVTLRFTCNWLPKSTSLKVSNYSWPTLIFTSISKIVTVKLHFTWLPRAFILYKWSYSWPTLTFWLISQMVIW